ncbi:S-layer homology domain-containing protein [Patescibacteria group bacterium]|nr:S-layer homology domain-containing protein [Patescibacteria group bacterium]
MKKSFILVAVLAATFGATVTAFAERYGGDFPDVPEGQYYTESAYRMRSLGVITGYENGNFGPNDYVNRAQLATMLDRYDQALLDPPAMVPSTLYDLLNVVCNATDRESLDATVQDSYDEACASLSNY